MADETQTPEIGQFSELPAPYMLPTQLLEKWLAIPPGQYVQVEKISRNDLDELFFALTRGFQAQQALHECLVRLSHNDLAAANKQLDDARRRTIEGDNSARKFFASVMLAATKS